MPKSYCHLVYHIVFSTKNRLGFLTEPLAPRIHEYLGGAIRGEGGTALAINGSADHVHLLAKLRQDKAVSDVIRNIKANSSGWIHQHVPGNEEFAWQAGYGAFSVSASQVSHVRTYVEHQAEHHRVRTFQEEFIALLEAHGVEYDERYIWT